MLLPLLGAVPFGGILGGVFFANRVTPYVLGMPFLLFWVVLWVVLSSAVMAAVYRLDPDNREPGEAEEVGP
ncbi:permease [Saccharothrix sp. ST-888]|nr:permease [Saccharothrix sp. ST-888]